MLRLQANHLDFKEKRQERLIRELEAATVKTKKLEENAEAARLAHMECKYTTEIMQLRIRELEDALNEEQGGRREAFSVVAQKDFRESENAHERGKKEHLSSSNAKWREGAEDRKETEEPSGRLVNAATSFSLHEGPVGKPPILLNLYQRMADSHVLAKQPNVPLEGLPWMEFCVLLYENVEALILNFHKANERISHLEYICKHKTDTMNDLQQNQEDALEKMSEQLKAQAHCLQKEKQYLEQQYSNLLAEVHARAQECEETAQKNRQKLYGLEQMCEKLAHENNSVRNTLTNVYKDCSSLLAACALLSGALCPLYGRQCAMSFQRDLLQDQVNLRELVNQEIRTLLNALPTNVENNQDEARLRQRRAKHLVYVFRRAVIAVLASNRLRALAQNSCSFFVWTDGSRGSLGIQVCVGESRGRHHGARFKEEGVDCIEALDWLTSSNLYTAIVSSISEVQGILSQPDPDSWLSGHSLISAARNSFSKLMDNLSVLMETVQGNPCGCRAYLERDSLIQRLACGLLRVNAQALKAGLYDRLPSTRNIAILQQEVFELSRRLHTAEVESHSLHLQLAEFKWTFSEMQRDAEKAHRLQEQLNALQHKIITQDNIHDELDKALQCEHEARLLLQEHQRRLQELSNRLELHTCADPDRSQDSKVSLMSLHGATEELRRRDQVLNHQKSLLKDMEQDQQQLRETLQEAEHALQQAAKDKELMINHMKAVDATLNAIRDQAMASGAAAATLLPSLKLETLSEETMNSRPEATAFQNVLISFMELYSLASARVEALTTGRESSGVHIEPEVAVTPPAPASKESLQIHFEPEAATTPPAPAPDESFWRRIGRQLVKTSPVHARDSEESFWRRIGHHLAKTPPAHARHSDESVGPRFVPKGAAAPHGSESDDIFLVSVAPQAAVTPPTPASPPDDIFQPHLSPQAASTPASPTPASGESFQLSFVPQGTSTPRGPAPDVHRGEPRQRTYVLSGTDTTPGVSPYRTYILSGTNTTSGVSPYRTYTVSGTIIAFPCNHNHFSSVHFLGLKIYLLCGKFTFSEQDLSGFPLYPEEPVHLVVLLLMNLFGFPLYPKEPVHLVVLLLVNLFGFPLYPKEPVHLVALLLMDLSGFPLYPEEPVHLVVLLLMDLSGFPLYPEEPVHLVVLLLMVHFEPEAATSPPAPAAAPASPHDDSFRRHIEPEADGTHPAPAPDESFWRRIGHHLAKTPPAHARHSDESVGPRFVPKGAAAPHGSESDDIFLVSVAPQAAVTPPTPASPPDDIFQPRVSPQASVTPPAPVTPAPTLIPDDIFQPRVSPQASVTPPAPATPAPTLAPDENGEQNHPWVPDVPDHLDAPENISCGGLASSTAPGERVDHPRKDAPTRTAAAKALSEPSHLDCWLGKQANRTSSVLSDLLTDEETVRHATLQNRAAIDFLLLAHEHGCEELGSLCCFNLSSPSEGIHTRIQRLQHAVQELQTVKESQWLEDLFHNGESLDNDILAVHQNARVMAKISGCCNLKLTYPPM
ncbi:PREDICTED: coiled-coil domain-containing protein 171-like [Pseudopodoces humilis]|uniref:coiled-coil domain-containing protein 171-like n=1 Tax=Pseudopodoces humilis TaxID=181119 RepID=UPI0003955F78|nr:PREDICTED: coiled-coil domain-containing protein 171-like [Pseudopodoces humilis]